MQQLRQKQIRGQLNETLEEDIKQLHDSSQFYDTPVKTKSELPLEGNSDGDMRVVLDEDSIYTWDEDTHTWLTKYDYYTNSISLDLVINQDSQSIINTGIKVGVVNGMVSETTVKLSVNGILQKEVRDYIVKIDTDSNCVIEWKSRDFQLEISDTITMSYDILLIS